MNGLRVIRTRRHASALASCTMTTVAIMIFFDWCSYFRILLLAPISSVVSFISRGIDSIRFYSPISFNETRLITVHSHDWIMTCISNSNAPGSYLKNYSERIVLLLNAVTHKSPSELVSRLARKMTMQTRQHFQSRGISLSLLKEIFLLFHWMPPERQ